MDDASSAQAAHGGAEAIWGIAAAGDDLDQDANRAPADAGSRGLGDADYKPTFPPEVTYTITKRVLELDRIMTELDRIAERWYGKSRRV